MKRVAVDIIKEGHPLFDAFQRKAEAKKHLDKLTQESIEKIKAFKKGATR